MSANTIMMGVGVAALLGGAGALMGLFGRGDPGSPRRAATRIAGVMLCALGITLIGFAVMMKGAM